MIRPLKAVLQISKGRECTGSLIEEAIGPLSRFVKSFFQFQAGGFQCLGGVAFGDPYGVAADKDALAKRFGYDKAVPGFKSFFLEAPKAIGIIGSPVRAAIVTAPICALYLGP